MWMICIVILDQFNKGCYSLVQSSVQSWSFQMCDLLVRKCVDSIVHASKHPLFWTKIHIPASDLQIQWEIRLS